jgi:two-component system, NtrC family, response regulator AtoC
MNILVVDDDAVQREMLGGFLINQGHKVLSAENGKTALEIFENRPIDLVLLDHRMPELTGDQVLAQMKAVNPLVQAILITAYGDVQTAVTVLKLGASDFLEKPVNLTLLMARIQEMEKQRGIEEDVAAVREVVEDGELPLKMIAGSPAMKEIISLVRRMADSPWPVLLEGETGTGKELMARLIHLLSPRRDQPFIEVNCAAVPESLFESELFGHEKGAFTGAINRRRGHMELADGGTLFLDEIGEMPLSLQPKLLRALQEKRVMRLGSEKDIGLDIRLVSATNRSLKSLLDAGLFREDLYYRLKVLELRVPPLRERREDIPDLVEYFLHRYATRPVRFAPETLDALIKYPYPGNVRELEHIVQRTITLGRETVVRPEDLPEEIRRHQASTHGTLVERLDALEKEMILSALEKKNGVQTQAAEMLGISERVLRYKLQKHMIRNAS